METEVDSPFNGLFASSFNAFEQIRYDLRGHGRSPLGNGPDSCTWNALSNDLLELSRHLGLQRFVAAGESAGGAISIFAAMKQPEAVRGLILVYPPIIFGRESRAHSLLKLAEDCEANGTIELAQSYEMVPSVPALTLQNRRIAEWLRNQNPTSIASLLKGAASSSIPNLEGKAFPAVPTLIVGVCGDPTHPVEQARELASRISGSRYEELPDLDPRALSDITTDFLNRLA